jgi:tRNA (cytidine/uridine-2'-O-)-methyltransferase
VDHYTTHMSPHIARHQLNLVLLQPQIAPNTGNIARLCVATGAELHLVRPLGFVLSDRNLKRSAMDYWPRLKLTVHDDDESLFKMVGEQRIWLFSSKGRRSLWDSSFHPADWLIFGSETHGISEALRARYATQTLRIPQLQGERCLNLATAAGIGLYEAIRQVQIAAPASSGIPLAKDER